MTTFYYPDVSHYQGSIELQPKTVATFAKATQGAGFVDDHYIRFKGEAQQVGSVFGAYHYAEPAKITPIQDQAAHAFSVIGKTPAMLDFEYVKGSTVSAWDELPAFIEAYRKLGGIMNLAYVPKSYWSSHLGSPNMSWMNANGVRLVSSHYTTYSDSGPGWEAYGGVTPYIWQYTSSFMYGATNKVKTDMNACKDTLANFAKVIGTTVPAAPVSTPPPAKPPAPGLPSHPNGSRTLQYVHGKPNMTGTDVQYLQKFIGAKHCGTADGNYGPNTAEGVSWYEGMRGIKQERPYGIAGPQVWQNILHG